MNEREREQYERVVGISVRHRAASGDGQCCTSPSPCDVAVLLGEIRRLQTGLMQAALGRRDRCDHGASIMYAQDLASAKFMQLPDGRLRYIGPEPPQAVASSDARAGEHPPASGGSD